MYVDMSLAVPGLARMVATQFLPFEALYVR